MPIPADDDPDMVDGWYALLALQERGRASARRLAFEMIGRPVRRTACTNQEEKNDG
jgi:hypothetical protein